LRKARRARYARRPRDPPLPALVGGAGKIMSDGSVELPTVCGSAVFYRVVPVLCYRVVPTTPAVPLLVKILRAVRASLDETLAVAGLPTGTSVTPIVRTVKQALGRKTSNAAIQRMASAAAYLEVEGILDDNTAQIAAE
jgi:hypothetical protein